MSQVAALKVGRPRAVSQSGKPLPEGKVSFEEFLDWLDDETHAEWVDGEVVLMAPINSDHQDVGSFLLGIVGEFVKTRRLGRIQYEPFQMKLPGQQPSRAPDLLFVSRKNAKRLKETFLDGPADLAIEIISPDSVRRDRKDKFGEYERGGVREYWLVDPMRKQVEVYVRDRKGVYQLAGPKDEKLQSTVLKGFWIDPQWLWMRPQPTVLEVLRAWGMVD